MSTALDLQRRLNVIRKNRKITELAPIEETGSPDKATRDALRAFQHEHNRFVGRRMLDEKGQLDPDTELALTWWSDVLEAKKERIA